MALRLTKAERKDIFHLPIEQAVLVPTTTAKDKVISKLRQKKRVREVKKFLSNQFGGFTSVSAKGGFYSAKEKKLIQEDVFVVTSFSTRKAHKKGLPKLKKKLRSWKKKWGQESMGYEHEGDLYYF